LRARLRNLAIRTIAGEDSTAHHATLRMADLEKLAIRRDRGYLLRLILLLAVGCLVSIFLFAWLTGSRTSGCVADSVGSGTEQKPEGAPK
jgi:hypothetical protein